MIYAGITKFIEDQGHTIGLGLDQEIRRWNNPVPGKTESTVKIRMWGQVHDEALNSSAIDLRHFWIFAKREVDQRVAIGQSLRTTHEMGEPGGAVSKFPGERRRFV